MKQDEFDTIVGAFFLYQGVARQILFEDRCGLTKLQAAALGALLYVGSMSMGELARCLAVSKEQATRTVAPLVDDGLVERAQDGRRVIASLTTQGKEFLDQQWNESKCMLEERFSMLSDDETARLVDASRTVSELFGKVLHGKEDIGAGPGGRLPTPPGPTGR